MARFPLTAIALLVAALDPVAQGLKMPTVVDSNMVLQRAPQRARVWGFANATEGPVKVTLDGSPRAYTSTVQNGQWSVDLDPQPASTGRVITVSSSAGTAVLKNIAFGDVYLCSGQSNMEFSVNDAFNASLEIADSVHYPNLRLFTVQKTVADSPMLDCASKSNYTWAVSAPDAFTPVGGPAFSWFSATCYFFGRDVYRGLGGTVPVGLVASDWGGQRVEAFSSPDAMADTTCGGTVPGAAPSQPPAANPGTSQLWNAMIYPLLPMRFAGATWYQGEANAGDPAGYACRFPAMIADWRRKMDLALPFLFVQLAAYSSDYSLIREAQMAALKLPRVGYALAIDIGDPTSPEGNIHPRRKQEVGRRLALAAMGVVYGQDVDWLGPQMVRQTFAPTPTGTMVTLAFSNASNMHAHGTAACVACCEESPFRLSNGLSTARANFTISGATVTLVAEVQHATQVLYDFEGYPQCALYNGEGGPDNHTGLPATPFRTPPPPPLNYTLVFRQTWPGVFKPGQWSVNPETPTADMYSILDRLESFRRDGRLGFRITWPMANGHCHWRQRSNPVTTTNMTVAGYQPINVTTAGFTGLRYDNKAALISGGPGLTEWYWGVGTFQDYQGGLPSNPGGPVVQRVELQARREGAWTTVCRQTLPALFRPGVTSVNADNPHSDQYCILDRLESFRGADGVFELRMYWPDMGNSWSQTSNPATATAGGVEGYQPGVVRYSDGFGGLENNLAGGQSLLDGSVDSAQWFYTIGDYGNTSWGQDGIPAAPALPGQEAVELYVASA